MRNAGARFEAEELIVSGNRATVLWVYDIFTVRDGKIAAKLAYVYSALFLSPNPTFASCMLMNSPSMNW
jgi:hypothetical protein